MVFLADGFTAWLAATMADAGRKKLSQFFTGTDEQGRALRSAATASIQATARELCPGNTVAAEHLARVIDELFTAPTRYDARDADATASQAIEASIGAQLAVLDDVSMTGVGQSAADSLEVSTAELTEKLYGRESGLLHAVWHVSRSIRRSRPSWEADRRHPAHRCPSAA